LGEKSKLVIPLDKIPEGVDLCLRNASQFCVEAKIVSRESSCEHALGLCLYAIEELGKAELLQGLAVVASKHGDGLITLERKEPQRFFSEAYHADLRKLGFSRPMNPFFDHRCKLFIGRMLVSSAAQERVMRSLDGQEFHDFKELVQAFEEKARALGKDVTDIDVKEKGFRELLMYVDYDQEKNEWMTGGIRFASNEIVRMSEDIEAAIQLFNRKRKGV
jgi:hypothetical protein